MVHCDGQDFTEVLVPIHPNVFQLWRFWYQKLMLSPLLEGLMCEI